MTTHAAHDCCKDKVLLPGTLRCRSQLARIAILEYRLIVLQCFQYDAQLSLLDDGSFHILNSAGKQGGLRLGYGGRDLFDQGARVGAERLGWLLAHTVMVTR